MAQAAVFHAHDKPLELRSFDTPVPHGREVLVRVMYCTLCRSDLHTHAGRRNEPTPTVLGHEIVGTIAAFGPDASHEDARGCSSVVGTRVTWSVAVGCGDCYYCKLDLPQKCEKPWKYGHRKIAGEPTCGGLSDYVMLVPNTVWYAIPDALPDRVAVLANCSTATAVAGLRYAGEIAGRSVVVLGVGVLGLTACALAQSMGAKTIVACDPNPASLSRAAAFGATHNVSETGEALRKQVLEITGEYGADVVLELAGVRETCQSSLTLTRIGGTVIYIGAVAPVEAIAIEPEQVIRRMLTLKGVHNYHPHDLGTALDFLAKYHHQYPFDSLVEAEYPLDQIETAFERGHASAGRRVAVIPGKLT